MAGLDRLLFRTVNGWPESLDALTLFSTANDWPFFRLAMALVLVAYGVVGRGRAALLSVVAFPLADGLCNLAKHLAPMPRPFQVLPHVTMRVGFAESMGTASSHAANLAAVATVMTLALGRRWGAPWIVVAFLVGLSRVYVGAHYPSQVLLGWAVGVAVGFAVERGARRWAERGTKGATRTRAPRSNAA